MNNQRAPASGSTDTTSQRFLLVGTGEGRLPDYTDIYDHLRQRYDYDVIALSSSEIRQLPNTLRKLDFARYERVVFDIPFKRLHKTSKLLKTISGLVIYEQDACQDFLQNSKWNGKFSAFYKTLPHARVAVTGDSVARRLSQLGISAHFVPKAFDEKKLFLLDKPRDIEAGFIGRVKSQVYTQRANLLNELADNEGVQLLRTSTPKEYCETLNRIGIFVSADIGLGEYMAKNFEAMACGCALLAWEQGNGEEDALGLKDMENVVLYRTPAEARDKLRLLRDNPELRETIARKGQSLVRKRYTFSKLADNLHDITSLPALPSNKALTLWEKVTHAFIRK